MADLKWRIKNDGVSLVKYNFIVNVDLYELVGGFEVLLSLLEAQLQFLDCCADVPTLPACICMAVKCSLLEIITQIITYL